MATENDGVGTPVYPIVVVDKQGSHLIGEWLYYKQKRDWSKHCWTKKRQESQYAKWDSKMSEAMMELVPWLEQNFPEFADRIVNVGEFGSSRKMYRCIYVSKEVEQ